MHKATFVTYGLLWIISLPVTVIVWSLTESARVSTRRQFVCRTGLLACLLAPSLFIAPHTGFVTPAVYFVVFAPVTNQLSIWLGFIPILVTWIIVSTLYLLWCLLVRYMPHRATKTVESTGTSTVR